MSPSNAALREKLETATPQELYHVHWVLEFLHNNEKSLQDKSDLGHFLTARVERQPSIFRHPVDDLEERFELILNLQQSLRTANELNENDIQAMSWAQAFLPLLSSHALRSLRDNQARLLQVCASVRPFTTSSISLSSSCDTFFCLPPNVFHQIANHFD